MFTPRKTTSRFVSLPSALKRRSLRPARDTPRSPEIDKDCFASKILKYDCLAVEKRQCERRGLSGNQVRLYISRVPRKVLGDKSDHSSGGHYIHFFFY